MGGVGLVGSDVDDATFETEWGAADRAVEAVHADARRLAVAQAALMASIAALADLCDDAEHDHVEVACALAWSSRFAEKELGWGRELMSELPEVFSAWQFGDIDRHRAFVFHDCLWLLFRAHGDDARRIASDVLPKAPRMTGTQLRERLRRLVLKVDPAARKKEIEATVAERDLRLFAADDGGTATLGGYNLPVDRAAAAFERVDAIARARRAGGDDRPLNALRGDTFLDLLEGIGVDTAPQFRQGVVELTIPLATAVDARQEPGDLAGYGPVLADVARQIARDRKDAQWRFSVTVDGELVYSGVTSARPDEPDAVAADSSWIRHFVSEPDGLQLVAHQPLPPCESDATTRFPGARLRRWILARDRTCQAPGCTAPGRICQLDHTVDHALGGPTADFNLGLLCEYHHPAKHRGWWTVVQIRPGHVLWITPHGHVYRQLD